MEHMNTNLSDYSIDELFTLFDININENTDYNSLTTQIENNGKKMINIFKSTNPEVANFINKAMLYLLKNKLDQNNSLIIEKPNHYKYGLNAYSSSLSIENNDYMFNSNNGAGNPIHRKTVTKLFNIDSRFRDNYESSTSTNFSLQLQIEQKNVIEMKLCDLEMPTNYYPISTTLGNNYMWIKYNYNNNTETINNDKYVYLFIPDGNYYYENLIDYINSTTCLSNDLLVNVNTGINSNIFFDLNYNNAGGVGSGTGKITFSLSSSNYSSMELNFNGSTLYINNALVKETQILTYSQMQLYGNKYNQVSNLNIQYTFGWVLGFKKRLYSSNRQYISEGIMDIIGPKYLYLVINDGIDKSVNTNFFAASGSGLDPNTIARISLKGAPFNIQSQNDFSIYTEPRYYFGPVTISKFNIKILDEYKRILDLNNSDISFTLRLTIIYSD